MLHSLTTISSLIEASASLAKRFENMHGYAARIQLFVNTDGASDAALRKQSSRLCNRGNSQVASLLDASAIETGSLRFILRLGRIIA